MTVKPSFLAFSNNNSKMKGEEGKKSVYAWEVTDDNIVQALAEDWRVVEPLEKHAANKTESTRIHSSSWSTLIEPLINEPRDVAVVNIALVGLLLPISSLGLFMLGTSWIQLVVHCVLLAVVTRRYVLALHVSSHKSLFRKEYQFLNYLLPVVLGPFFGQPPFSYFYHHLKMYVLDNQRNP